jgi:hypothetical protein
MFATSLCVAAGLAVTWSPTLAAIPDDLVASVPTFPSSWPFKYYSGYLTVPGPFEQAPYSKVKVRYELQMSQGSSADPLVSWHQGGPGWSSSFGSWGKLSTSAAGAGRQSLSDAAGRSVNISSVVHWPGASPYKKNTKRRLNDSTAHGSR